MKKLTTLLFILLISQLYAQVGIGTIDPNANLDIKATNQATPTNTDGVLIPRIDTFPTINPTADQNGMLIFLTTDNKFYYWKNSISSWVSILSGIQKIDDLIDGKSDNNGSSVFLGIDAGLNDDGSNNQNIGLGYRSLYQNTTGHSNSVIGYNSNYNNTTGYHNVANGHNSLYNNTTGYNNVANGFWALKSNTTGNNNTANGNESLKSNTTGYYNTANGNLALNKNTIGTFNTAVGSHSLYYNISGNSNSAFGYHALNQNTSAYNNTAIGTMALYYNKTGSYATAIGSHAMYNSNDTTTSFTNNNVAVGNHALYGSTTAANNTGNNNTALGSNTLYKNSSGSNNTVIGYYSLYHNIQGNNNTANGNKVLYNNLNGNNNTSLGYQSGFESLGTGNVFLGHKSGYNETGDNNLYIENTDADADNALIYGEFGSDNTTIGNVLRTNSSFQIGNPAITGYAFPTTDGSENSVLKTDGSGTLSWQDGTSNFSMVSAFIVNGGYAYVTDASNDWEKLEFDAESFDTNIEFNVISNTFTAQKAGYYQVEAQFVSELSNLTNQFGIGIYKNNVIFAENSYNHSGTGLIVRQISKLIYLAVNDTVSIYISDNSNSIAIDKWSGKTFFTINRVR